MKGKYRIKIQNESLLEGQTRKKANFASMDCRSAFNSLDDIRLILETLHANKAQASLLVDKDGLTRMKGRIVDITPPPGSDRGETIFYLENGDSFMLRQIAAVNGEFRSDYFEC